MCFRGIRGEFEKFSIRGKVLFTPSEASTLLKEAKFELHPSLAASKGSNYHSFDFHEVTLKRQKN